MVFHPKNRRICIIILGFLLVFSLVVVACQDSEPATVEVTRVVEVPVEVPGETVEVEVTRVVEVMAEPEAPETAVSAIPFEEQWANSPHNDTTAEAFIHWNEDDPQEIPPACARCHSTPGFQDYIGSDGTEAGVVDSPAPIGTTVECAACHNDVTVNMTSVVFPSGVEVVGLGDESRCMQCHQGRHSTVSVNQSIADAGLGEGDEDTISEDLGFSNIHYYAAAATLYGTVTMGGYEYDGKGYDSKHDHVPGYDTCIDCHDPHTLEVKLDECSQCHANLNSTEDLVDVRMNGSLVDYDGDGDQEEGIYFEIEGMRALLYEAMLAYTAEVTGTPIGYDEHAYPYFFVDTDGNGELSEEEAVFPNSYNAWTPRLAKAAYNYQVSLKDPGRFAHGGKYIIQLLYDSIESLNEAITTPIDLTDVRRIDHGHFAGSEEAFRHWDEDGFVPGRCSRCHSAAGLPLYIEQGVSINQPTANGLNCTTCHRDLATYQRYQVDSVTFPSGATVTLVEDEDDTAGQESNLCINCHQGRSSTVSVNAALADLPDDDVSEDIRFINIHYFAAGATLFGNDVQGAYQYADKEYLGRNDHVGRFDSCVECHNTHALEIKYEECADCHESVTSLEDLTTIRVSETDFDGDGDVTEGLAGEIDTMAEAVYLAMQDYANNNPDTLPIIYNPQRYPYFFADANGNGEIDGEEGSYNTWTPNLLRAAYNYQYAQKDPGAFAHNGQYVLQVLYDSLEGIGGDTTGMTRP